MTGVRNVRQSFLCQGQIVRGGIAVAGEGLSSGWRKATRCDSGACVEVAGWGDGAVMRDSKDPRGPILAFGQSAWYSFLREVRADDCSAARS